MMHQKQILLIGTGGTIASRQGGFGLKPMISPEELLTYVPDAKDRCRIDTVQAFNIDSTNLQPQHWLTIARIIEERYDAYDGFVVCHGTDTMAYTSAALSYLIQDSVKPIVVTGAQKPIDQVNTDARTNLRDSLAFASHDRAHGVNIVFDGKVIAGTRARKERTKSYNAFSSINFPCLSVIQGGRVLFYLDDRDQERRPMRFFHELNPSVGLIKLIPSQDAFMLKAMASHYDGIIIESYGVGGLPSYAGADFHSAVGHLVSSGKTVVMATQVSREGSDMTVYEIGQQAKRAYGLLETYDMTLEATVTKLMWILGQTRDPHEVERMFYQTVNRDILYPPSLGCV